MLIFVRGLEYEEECNLAHFAGEKCQPIKRSLFRVREIDYKSGYKIFINLKIFRRDVQLAVYIADY
jgi:hypothetical protein